MKNGKKRSFFHGILTYFWLFFIDCGYIYVPNGVFWGSTRGPQGDLVMILIFTLGSTVHDWGWPKNGPFQTKKWPNMAGLSTFQSGPKGIKMANLSVFDHLEPFWTLLYHFKQKLFFCSRAPPPNPTLSIWWLQSFSVKVAVRSTTDVWSNLTVFLCNLPSFKGW